MPMSHEIHLRCCFCGKEIDEKPRTITVTTDDGQEQRLFAHTACFRDRLDDSVPFGQAGAFGVEMKDRRSRWTMKRVIAIGVIVVLVLLAPMAIIAFVQGP